MNHITKWKPVASLAATLDEMRSQGKRIVLANGVFDILHVGHIRYLKEARTLGDVLVVAINEDSSVRTLKGEKRPIVPLAERIEIIAAIDGVDYVVSFSDARVDTIIEALRPHVHAKGTDYDEETVPERETVERCGGKVAIVGGPKQWSSTALFYRIQNAPVASGLGGKRTHSQEGGCIDGT